MEKAQVAENEKLELQKYKQLYFQWKMKIGNVKQVLTSSKVSMNSTDIQKLIEDKKEIVKNMWLKKELLETQVAERIQEIHTLG